MQTRRFAPIALLAFVLIGAAGLTSCTPRVQAVETARAQMGIPYRSGGATPAAGFDCSGLTSYAWGKAGVQLPRTSAAQYAATTRISRAELQPGDLIFYASGSRVSHVAMYIGNNKVVHARKTGMPVREDNIDWWKGHEVGYGRVKGI